MNSNPTLNSQSFSTLQASRQEVVRTLHEIAEILNVKLDMEELSILLELCDRGLNAEALVSIVKEIKEKKDF